MNNRSIVTNRDVTSVILLLAIFLGGLLVPATVFCAKKPVKIGILANGGMGKVLTMWSATTDYLNDWIPGYSFSVVPLDFGNIGPTVGRGEVDFVLTNSSNYVDLETLYGASRILTLINRTGAGGRTVFGGVIFCRRDRKDINGLDDLKGKSFMAVAENSLGGWQASWRELRDKGINPYSDFTSLRFGQTQDAVVHAVRDGTVDAGTVRTDTLERMSDKGEIDLSEFHILNRQSSNEFPFALSTRLYPEWPFAKLKHTDNTLAQKVIIALLRMPPDSPAAKAGKIVGWTIPLDYRPVHELMRELQIGPYKNFGKVTLISAVRQHWYWFVSGMLATLFMAGATVYVLHLNRKLVQSRQLLERANAELRMKQQQFGELNATLEQRVQEEIASRQEKEQLLFQQSRMAAMGEMIGAIAHQWRQPLNVIGLIIQNLQMAYEYGEMDKERINNAVATSMWQINFMSKTIDDFRNFFKPSKEKEIFDVQKVVDETIFLMKAQLQNNYIDIDVIVEKEGIAINGYPNELKHVLLNLINNGKDAILVRKAKENCRAELTIQISEKAGKVIVEVRDTGGGIPEGLMDKIFDPYFTTKDEGTGTGIGLYISKTMIEKNLGGQLTVRNWGDGAEFRIEV
jgi:signal transduction histidine kinase